MQRKEDDRDKDNSKKATFSQEVAMAISIHSYLSNLKLPVILRKELMYDITNRSLLNLAVKYSVQRYLIPKVKLKRRTDYFSTNFPMDLRKPEGLMYPDFL